MIKQTVYFLLAVLLTAPAFGQQVDPVYRWWNARIGDHFFTTDPTGELAPASGYVREGVGFKVLKCQLAGTVPLYRLWSGQATDHFYTSNFNEAANASQNLKYAFEGILGFLYKNYKINTKPVHRYWNPSNTDHFYTINIAAESLGGYNYEGVVGYAPN